jgi:G3E family GTPase
VIATVDAVNGALHLAENPESVKQVAVADRIVLTKTELAAATPVAELSAALRRLNPTAPVLAAGRDPLAPDDLMANDVYDPASKSAEVRRWLDDEAHRAAAEGSHHHPDPNRHDRAIHAFCLTFAEPLDWTAFGIWLSMLLHVHGARVLRVKGILNVAGLATPVVIHGVQHVIHPPAHLEVWPDGDRRSRIVFIVRGLDQSVIERSLAAFHRQADAARDAA